MSERNNFNETVEALFKGMDNFITTKTVVGEAIHIGDTIILPLADVSFGLGAGAFAQEDGQDGQGRPSKTITKNNGGGGMGGRITPSAVLVVQNGAAKLVNIKNQDGITKILDLVPDILDRFSSGKKGKGRKAEKEDKGGALDEDEELTFTIVEEDDMEDMADADEEETGEE